MLVWLRLATSLYFGKIVAINGWSKLLLHRLLFLKKKTKIELAIAWNQGYERGTYKGLIETLKLFTRDHVSLIDI